VTLHFGDGVEVYLQRHGGALTIRSSPRHGCCGGTVAVAVAEAGPPRDAAAYQVEQVEGVRVYLERELRDAVDGPVRIDLEGFGPWRRLWVSGIEPRM
jgi:hypothetical protein